MPKHEIPEELAAELTRYWKRVAERALPYLGRRLLGLQFYDEERIHTGGFKGLGIPKAVHLRHIVKSGGKKGERVWIESVEGLLGLVEMGVVELHPWGSTVDDIDHPDLLVVNLRPGPDFGWEDVTEAAQKFRHVLEKDGCRPWVKTSGEIGLHIMIPADRSRSWAEAKKWMLKVAGQVAATDSRYILNKNEDRHEKLYLDCERNNRGNHTIGAFSPLHRARLPVSYPIRWPDVARGVAPDAWTVQRLLKRKN